MATTIADTTTPAGISAGRARESMNGSIAHADNSSEAEESGIPESSLHHGRDNHQNDEKGGKEKRGGDFERVMQRWGSRLRFGILLAGGQQSEQHARSGKNGASPPERGEQLRADDGDENEDPEIRNARGQDRRLERPPPPLGGRRDRQRQSQQCSRQCRRGVPKARARPCPQAVLTENIPRTRW